MNLQDLKPRIKDVPLYGPGQRFILGQRGYDPTGIVLHTPVGHVWSNIGLKWWFDSGEARGITHYAADMATGRIFQHVSPPWMVAANSHGDANRNLLSIEVDDQGMPNDRKRTDKVYESTGRLVAYLAVRYNWVESGGKVEHKKHVHLHRDFTDQKTCPAGLDYKRIIKIANRWLDKYWQAQKQEVEEKTPPQKPVQGDSDTKGGQSVETGQESQGGATQGDNEQVNDNLDINNENMANLDGGDPQVNYEAILATQKETLGTSIKNVGTYGGTSGAIATALIILLGDSLESREEIAAATFLLTLGINALLVLLKKGLDRLNWQ